MNISKKMIMSFIVALTSVVSMAQPYYHIMKEENGKLIEDTVYNGMDYNIKIDMNEPKPDDAIGGKITIESDWHCTFSKLKRSFYFTKHGNVYYNKSEDKFHFEKSQLDYPRGNYSYNHVGHFRWGRSIKECIELGSVGYTGYCFGKETTFYFSNPDTLPRLQEDLGNEKWAVLSYCEWQYVCETLGESGWTVNNEPCFLIDATPGKSLLTELRNKNNGNPRDLSIDEFKSLEAKGLVCLPASGDLCDRAKGMQGLIINPYFFSRGSMGYYWSCTSDYTRGQVVFSNLDTYGTYHLSFESSRAGVYHGTQRYRGYAVRLVILAD